MLDSGESVPLYYLVHVFVLLLTTPLIIGASALALGATMNVVVLSAGASALILLASQVVSGLLVAGVSVVVSPSH